MNKRKPLAHLTAADDYFLITLKGDTMYTDIDINDTGEEFVKAVRDELKKMLEAKKLIQLEQAVRTHKESK